MNGLQRALRDPRSAAELIEPALAEAERDDFIDIHDPAVSILQTRGSREILNATLGLCASPDPKRRALAAEILGQLGFGDRTFPEECCDALLDLVRRDADRDVLTTAVFALGHLGNRRGDPDLIALKAHPDNEVRRGVAFSLNGATSLEAIQTLLELMEDPYELAQDWATTAIAELESGDSPEIRAALWQRVSDSDRIVRAEALNGLARRQDRRAVLRIIAELSGADADSFHDAAKTVLGLEEGQSFSTAYLLKALRRSLVVD